MLLIECTMLIIKCQPKKGRTGIIPTDFADFTDGHVREE